MAKQVLERNIDYIEQIDGDNNYVESMKFASLYAKFVSLVHNYNGLFDEEQTRRLRWLADYLYENYRDGFESNIKSLKIPSNVASKIAELCSSEKEKASEALTKFFSNNDIKTAKAIDDIAKKLGKEASTFESSLQKKVDKLKAVASTASKYGVRGEKTATDEFATDLIETVSKKFGSSKTIVDLNWKIGTFTKDFSMFTTGLKTQADRLKKNIDAQNKLIDNSVTKPTSATSFRDAKIRNLNSLLMKSMMISQFRTVEVPKRAIIFKTKIKPIIENIVEKTSKIAVEKTTFLGGLKHQLSKYFENFNVKLQGDVYYNFKNLVLDPLKGLAKKVFYIGLIKNLLGLGILKYVQKAVHFAANLVKASINNVFDIIEGTISFAYNKVLVPIVEGATKILGLATRVFKKHFQNSLVEFLKTYPGAVFLGYITGLIVNGVKRAYHSLFDRNESDEDKTFFELMREKYPFVDRMATRFEKIGNRLWKAIEPTYQKILKFGQKAYEWWNGKRHSDRTPPKQVVRNVAVWIASKGADIWKWISSIDFVKEAQDISINFTKVMEFIAPGYRHAKQASYTAKLASKIKGQGSWLGILLNLASLGMMVGGGIFTFMNRPYVFGRSSIKPKKAYAKYFNIDGDNLANTSISKSQLEKLRETTKNLSEQDRKKLEEFYQKTSKDVIYEAMKIDDLIARLQHVENYYNDEDVNEELKQNVYEDLENLILDINTQHLTDSGTIIDPTILKEKFNSIEGGYKNQLNFLESLLNVRSSYTKQILEMLTDVSNPERTEFEVRGLLKVLKGKFANIGAAYVGKGQNKQLKKALERSPEDFTLEDLSSTKLDGLGLGFGNELMEIRAMASRNPTMQNEYEKFETTIIPKKDSGIHTSLEVTDTLLKTAAPLGIDSKRKYGGLSDKEKSEVMDSLTSMMLLSIHKRTLEEFTKLLDDLTNKRKILSPEFAKQFHIAVVQQYDKLSQNYIAQNRSEVNEKKIADIEKSMMQNSIYGAFAELRKNDDDEILEQINRLKEQKIFNGSTYGDSLGNEAGLTNRIFSDLENWGDEAKNKFGLLNKEEKLVLEALEKIIYAYDNTPDSSNRYSRR